MVSDLARSERLETRHYLSPGREGGPEAFFLGGGGYLTFRRTERGILRKSFKKI